MLCLPRSACPLWHCCQEGRGEKAGEDEGGVETERGREGHAVARERERERAEKGGVKEKELRKSETQTDNKKEREETVAL